MTRKMCGKALLDQISNSVLRGYTDVEDIEEHSREHHLTWLGHFERMNVKSFKRRVYEKKIKVDTRRRLKETGEMVKRDMRRNVSIEDVYEREVEALLQTTGRP